MGPLPRRGENQLALLWFPPSGLVAPSPVARPIAKRRAELGEADLSESANHIALGHRAWNLGSAGNLFGISRFDACHIKMTF